MLYTPLCWVRKIESFNASHIFADLLILISTITIIYFATERVVDEGWGEGVVMVNSTFLNMIGFAVYSYEGIGVVIPIMDITKDEKKYPYVLFGCLTTVYVLYLSFGLYCYFAYGNLLVLPLITSNFPPTSIFGRIVKILFCVNLLFSYPLMIYPANIIAESYLFKNLPKSALRMWLKNLYRAFMVLITIIIALALGNNLNKFLSLLGAVACIPIAFSLPALFHFKACA